MALKNQSLNNALNTGAMSTSSAKSSNKNTGAGSLSGASVIRTSTPSAPRGGGGSAPAAIPMPSIDELVAQYQTSIEQAYASKYDILSGTAKNKLDALLRDVAYSRDRLQSTAQRQRQNLEDELLRNYAAQQQRLDNSLIKRGMARSSYALDNQRDLALSTEEGRQRALSEIESLYADALSDLERRQNQGQADYENSVKSYEDQRAADIAEQLAKYRLQLSLKQF